MCTSDCPLIAQEFRQAGQLLGADRVDLVAVNYNPLYAQVSYLQAFDSQEGLNGVRNWRYLTGSPATLARVWAAFGVDPAAVLPAGSMIGHGDYAFVIDQHGRIRRELGFDPGPAPSPRSRRSPWSYRRRPPAAGLATNRRSMVAALPR